MVNYDKVPNDSMKSAVETYVENGQLHGDFLKALLTNDFHGAMTKSDHKNRKVLDEWAHFLYWELPADSWGSEKAVNEWQGISE